MMMLVLRKKVTLTTRVGPNLTFNDDGELEEVCCADQALVGVVDELGVMSGFWLPKKDSGERRGIEDHLGRPRSS